MFEFSNGGNSLAEFNPFSYFNQALGFYDKLVLEKVYLQVDENLLLPVLFVTQDIAFTRIKTTKRLS